jgi:hypothetical protein
MDHHTVAAVSVTGICLDVFGGLYLAYDLLGGQYGPLRLLTRMVTYSIAFGIGYGIGLGFFFGVVSGIATGVTVAMELQRAGRTHGHFRLRYEILFSVIRSAAFGAGLYRMVGLPYASAFAAFVAAGQVFAYTRGMRPGLDYSAQRRPRLSRKQFWGSVVRTIGYIATALFTSAVVQHVDHPWRLAIRLGLVTGVVTTVGITFNPFIEYFADNLPERRLGVFGIWMVLCGFALQTVQYFVALLDIPVT